MNADVFSKPFYTVEELATIVREAGYKAEIQTNKLGQRHIRSSAAGRPFSIYGYGSDDTPDHFTSIQFCYGIEMKPGLDAVNAWNRDKRLGKVYLDEVEDLWLEWDCIVMGVSAQCIAASLDWFDMALGQIETVGAGQ